MTASWEWETQHDCLGQEGLPLRSIMCGRPAVLLRITAALSRFVKMENKCSSLSIQ